MKQRKTKKITIKVTWAFIKATDPTKILCMKCQHNMKDGCELLSLSEEQRKNLIAIKCKWFEL